MIIHEPKKSIVNGYVELSVRAEYETSDRPEANLWYILHDDYADFVCDVPYELAATLVLVAWRNGERRIRFCYGLCPEFQQNIRAALRLLEYWYPYLGHAPRLEGEDTLPEVPKDQFGAVQLVSGGVDSLSALRANKISLPPDYSRSVRAGVVLCFCSNKSEAANALDTKDNARLRSIQECCDDLSIYCIPVASNVWNLVNWGYFYDQVWHGAVLTGAASILCKKFQYTQIAATFTSGYLAMPWGSHPLLDENYSTSRNQIKHVGLGMLRKEKVALLSKWPVGLDNVRVCTNIKDGSENCGNCEKCFRTMLALIACDGLSRCKAFKKNDLSTEDLEDLFDLNYPRITAAFDLHWYRELEQPLEEIGRMDLSTTIRNIVRFYNEMNGRVYFAERVYENPH